MFDSIGCVTKLFLCRWKKDEQERMEREATQACGKNEEENS